MIPSDCKRLAEARDFMRERSKLYSHLCSTIA
jgi:hypothetical protein